MALMRKNIIERTAYRKEVLQLAAGGVPSEEIAERLNEWDQGRSGVTFTEKQIEGFLERTLEGGKDAAISLQRRRDAVELTSLAKSHMEMFRLEVQLAMQNSDQRRLKLASENLLSWWDRNAEMEGLVGKTAGVELNVNVSADKTEMDALKRAIMEEMADQPDVWPKILAKAQFYAQNPQSKGIIDAQGKPSG